MVVGLSLLPEVGAGEGQQLLLSLTHPTDCEKDGMGAVASRGVSESSVSPSGSLVVVASQSGGGGGGGGVEVDGGALVGGGRGGG